MCTSAARPSTAIVATSVARSAAIDGPERGCGLLLELGGVELLDETPAGNRPRNAGWGPDCAGVVGAAAPHPGRTAIQRYPGGSRGGPF